jgi:hypothetical protein
MKSVASWEGVCIVADFVEGVEIGAGTPTAHPRGAVCR